MEAGNLAEWPCLLFPPGPLWGTVDRFKSLPGVTLGCVVAKYASGPPKVWKPIYIT
jgi:hypothetical protein